MRACLVLLVCLPLALCAVHKFELGDFASVHKLQYDVPTSLPKVMSKEEIHKELQSLRQRRSNGQPVNYNYVFNDQHSSGTIQYSGTDQQVIFLLTYNLNNGVPASGTNLYKSIDYGKTFSKINNRLESSGTLRLWNNFFVSPENYNQIVFPHATQSKMYVTTNEGGSFKTINLPNNINPRSLTFNPTKGEWFLAIDATNQLWLSEDLGTNFIRLASSVVAFDWGDPGTDSSSTIVYYWSTAVDTSGGSYLYSVDRPYDTPTVFDPSLGAIEGYSMVGSFIFTQKSVGSTISLWVSHNRGSFNLAKIPSTVGHQNYFVTSIQDYQALVIVEHVDGVYTLYMSGEDGVVFSESLPNVYTTSDNGRVTFDIELLDSMNGTFIANQVLSSGTSSGDVSRRTLISFDNGGNWNLIQPPATFKNGSLVNCEPPACSLHFHMATSEYWRTGVYSQGSAPGIIIAHGSIGSQLSSNPDLYLSRDGGITWSQTLLSSWGVSVLDHGGLIVAAADYHQTRSSVVQYTCTEGLSWSSFDFGQLLTVYGVITEPGETTTVVTLYGWENGTSGWISAQINFTNIFDRQCTQSDYYNWEPYDENLNVDCLNGATVVIERRKPDSCCLNGLEYERQLSYSVCECTSEDYQCDYGYMHSEGFTGPCVRDETISLPETCVGDDTYYLQSSGYRKIPGDVCVDGVSSEYDPFNVKCCSPPSTVTVTETDTIVSTSYTSTITTTYPGATATTTLSTTLTQTILAPTTVSTTITRTVPAPGSVTTACSSSLAPTGTSAATTDSASPRTIFLAVFIVLLSIVVAALVVVTIVLGVKLRKKGAAGYSSVSTHYRPEAPSGSAGRETSPGVAINHAADDSDEGDKDDDLLIP